MKDKYCNSSYDTVIDYESDKEIRERNGEKNQEKRRLERFINCNYLSI